MLPPFPPSSGLHRGLPSTSRYRCTTFDVWLFVDIVSMSLNRKRWHAAVSGRGDEPSLILQVAGEEQHSRKDPVVTGGPHPLKLRGLYANLQLSQGWYREVPMWAVVWIFGS